MRCSVARSFEDPYGQEAKYIEIAVCRVGGQLSCDHVPQRSNHKCLQTLLSERDMSAIRYLFPEISLIQQIHGAGVIECVQFVIFVKKCLLGKCTGISFVDSTPLRVCVANQRIHMHKVFQGIGATVGSVR